MKTKTGKEGIDQQPLTAVPGPTFLIDSREQTPFPIHQLRDWDGGIIGKDRVTRGCLSVGDYSIQGMETRIAIERKSHCDLFGSLTFGRDRLIAEIQRARSLDFFAIVTECPLERISRGHPRHHRFSGPVAARTILSWQVKFPWCSWWLCSNRDQAALVTVRLLERFAMIQPETPEPVELQSDWATEAGLTA